MPTPPRTLPSSSPSSARLRRIAPSPVIIPLPPCRDSPRKVQSRLASQHVHLAMLSGVNGSGLEELSTADHVGYEFLPLEPGLGEGWLTPSPIGAEGQQPLFAVPELQLQLQLDHTRKAGCAIGSIMPVILDRRGEFGRIASDWRFGVNGLDVPDCVESVNATNGSYTKDDEKGDEIQVTLLVTQTRLSKRRSGPTMLSPKRYMDKHVPRPILVDFRTDVFSIKGREEIRQEEKRTREESTPRVTTTNISARLKRYGDDEDMVGNIEDRLMSVAESWKTFGSQKGSPESIRTITNTNTNNNNIVDVIEETGHSDVNASVHNGNDQHDKPDQDVIEDEDIDGDGWSFMLSAYQDQDRDPNREDRKGSFSSTSAYSDNDIRSRTSSFGHTTNDLGLKINHGSSDKIITPLAARLLGSASGFIPPLQMQKDLDSPASDIILTPLRPAFLGSSSTLSITSKPDNMTSNITSTSSISSVDPQIKRWPQNQSQSYLTEGQSQWNDSPTPKPKSQSHPLSDPNSSLDQDKSKIRNQNRRSRAPTLDKALPELPIIVKPPQDSYALGDDKTHHVADVVGINMDPVEMALREMDKNITVQLWVDQEGTRAHRTSLKYLRSIKASTFRERELNSLQKAAAWCESPTRPEMFQQTGAWVFGLPPRERDKWNFHSAALEGLPVLRRLTINNDEKHDYLSRGATLQIKEPGVYAVHGVDDRRGAGGEGRAEWKFEYLVQPRISLTTGEEINGEKLVIPLALYVTPTFFNSERGHKTHLLNMFKKTLAPNIVSEKIRPPHVGKPPQKTGTAPTPVSTIPGPLASIRLEESNPQLTATPVATAPAPASIGKVNNALGMSSKPGNHTRHRSDMTQSHLIDIATPTSVPHARSVSRTINAFAKAVTGLGSATPTQTTHTHTHTHTELPPTPTPLSGNGVHKFGSKSPGFATLRSGRSRTTTASSILTNTYTNIQDLANVNIQSVTEDKDKKEKGKEKGKTRNRATSLFSRSRPFTPPVNITALHPVPPLAVSPTPIPGHLPSTSTRLGNGNARYSTLASGPGHSEGRLPLPLQSYKGMKGRPTTSPSPSPANSRGPSSSPSPSPLPSPLTYHAAQAQRPAVLGQQTSHLHPFYQQSLNQQPLNQGPNISTPSLSRSASTSSRQPRIVTPTRPFIHGYSMAMGIDSNQIERERTEIVPVGLTPAPRKRPVMRKRPSTAEPRLGM